jgi:hypothetical protein
MISFIIKLVSKHKLINLNIIFYREIPPYGNGKARLSTESVSIQVTQWLEFERKRNGTRQSATRIRVIHLITRCMVMTRQYDADLIFNTIIQTFILENISAEISVAVDIS